VSGARTGAGYERIEVATRPVVAFAVLLAAVVLIALGVLRWQYGLLASRARAEQVPLHPLAAQTEVPPEPRLLADPGASLAAYQEEERKKLETPAWIDQSAGIVRVPIERAMELLVREGVR
jgi:hypothetical protein